MSYPERTVAYTENSARQSKYF